MGGGPTTDEVSAELGVLSRRHVVLQPVPPVGEDPDVFLRISTTRGNLVEGWRVVLRCTGIKGATDRRLHDGADRGGVE